ncbi:hypothetical protein [Niabella aurantiaca]|uniref:hypothetical protein n=1 Tax=Niabella aurantiaca TaxID=379900 RepID=UPI0012FC1B49|nr:hypothetical protein [Niabella aurantiaca]
MNGQKQGAQRFELRHEGLPFRQDTGFLSPLLWAAICKKREATIILAKKHDPEGSGKNRLQPVYTSKRTTERHGPGA